MDLFGFKRRRNIIHNKFMNSLGNQSDEYLLTAWSALDMDSMCGMSNEYTLIEFRAVEAELEKRGYTDEMGYISGKKNVK